MKQFPDGFLGACGKEVGWVEEVEEGTEGGGGCEFDALVL